MTLSAIRDSVRSLFDEIGELAVTATLRRKQPGPHMPGAEPAEHVIEQTIRLLPMARGLRESGKETDRILEPALQHALIESAHMAPMPGDDLRLPERTVTLQQVAAVDLGAGILYEVFYQ